MFAFKPGNVFKDYMITDIYTISKDDGQVIRLTDGLQLGMLGERMTLAYLKDKTFSYYGSVGATAGGGSGYHFNNDVLSKTTVIQVLKKQIFLVGIGRI